MLLALLCGAYAFVFCAHTETLLISSDVGVVVVERSTPLTAARTAAEAAAKAIVERTRTALLDRRWRLCGGGRGGYSNINGSHSIGDVGGLLPTTGTRSGAAPLGSWGGHSHVVLLTPASLVNFREMERLGPPLPQLLLILPFFSLCARVVVGFCFSRRPDCLRWRLWR